MSNTVRIDPQAFKPPILTQRYVELQAWLEQELAAPLQVRMLPADASFRLYYRIFAKQQTYIAMDSPPDKESCDSFVSIARAFKQKDINTPKIYAEDFSRGFLLLEDLGDRLYFRELTAENVGQLYLCAFQTLLKIQQANIELPLYNENLLLTELNLCTDWYITQYLKINLNAEQKNELHFIFSRLIEEALAQPQVNVHRDYHSRNLLVCDQDVGVLDFQDAVQGPITYDLVSLLKDCYIDWPRVQVEKWVKHYWDLLLQKKVLTNVGFTEFLRWFDLMGLQRHLKCLGIFSRKFLRDQNENYLQDIPRLVNYIKWVCQQYPDFKPLLTYLQV